MCHAHIKKLSIQATQKLQKFNLILCNNPSVINSYFGSSDIILPQKCVLKEVSAFHQRSIRTAPLSDQGRSNKIGGSALILKMTPNKNI